MNFNKPLLYGKVVESIRQHYALKAHVQELVEQQADEPEPKQFFGLFGGKSKNKDAESS